MPKGKVDAPISDKEIRFAHFLLTGEMTDRQAAEAAGLKPSAASYVKAKPQVKDYMAQHRAKVQDGLAQHEVKALAGLNISRDQLFAEILEVARTPPERTKGSIMGQIEAYKTLCDRLGYVAPDPKELPASKPRMFRAEWLGDSGVQ